MNGLTLKILLILTAIAAFVCLGISVAMIISAVQFLEWGRVIFYGILGTVCIEIAVLALIKQRKIK